MTAPQELMLSQIKRQLEQELMKAEGAIWRRIKKSIDEHEMDQLEKKINEPVIVKRIASHKK